MIRNSLDSVAANPVDALAANGIRQEGTIQPRVSGPQRETEVTILAYDEDEPSKSNFVVRYQHIIYAIVIALLAVSAVWGLVLVLRPTRSAKPVEDEINKVKGFEVKSFDWSEYNAMIEGLSKEECVAIFNTHHKMLVDPNPTTGLLCEPNDANVYYHQWPVQQDEAKRSASCKLMEKHENRFFRDIYYGFERSSTTEVALRLATLKYFKDPKDVEHTMIGRQLFNVLILDERMRKYLAYRGLRRKVRNQKSQAWTWGTVIFCDQKKKKPADYRPYKVVPDAIKEIWTYAVGDWNEVNQRTADRELSGVSNLKDVEVHEGTKRILKLGTDQLPLRRD